MPYSATDEDFIRRYGDNPNAPDLTPVTTTPAPTTTQPVLPTNLIPFATRNLATEDASLARVNAAARATTLPGVGALGSTLETDQTNLNIAAAMDRAEQRRTGTPTIAGIAMDEFSQRRQQIEAQKTQLMAKLGMVPPSAAGFAAVVLPSQQRGKHGEPSEYDRALGQLHQLDQDSRQLLQEHHYSAIENARTAHEDLARQTHIQVSSGLAKVLSGINRINQQYSPGSPEARSAMLNLVSSDDSDIAAARGSSSFEKLVKPHTDLHDVSADRLTRAMEAHKAAHPGVPITSIETTATGGINIRSGTAARGGTSDAPKGADVTTYTKLQANRAAQQVLLDKETDPKLQADLKKHIEALDVEMNVYHQRFPQLAPKGETGAATVATATQPDLKALAQKALNDPNASEAHKAAARKILGQ